MRNRVLVNALNVDWQHSVIFDLQTTSFLCMHTFHIKLFGKKHWSQAVCSFGLHQKPDSDFFIQWTGLNLLKFFLSKMQTASSGYRQNTTQDYQVLDGFSLCCGFFTMTSASLLEALVTCGERTAECMKCNGSCGCDCQHLMPRA